MANPIKVILQDRQFNSINQCRAACAKILALKDKRVLAQGSFANRVQRECAYEEGAYVKGLNLEDFAEIFDSVKQSEDGIFYTVTFKNEDLDAVYVGITTQFLYTRLKEHINDAFSDSERSKAKFHQYLKMFFEDSRPTLDEFTNKVHLTYSDRMPASDVIKKEKDAFQKWKELETKNKVKLLNIAPGGSLHGRTGSVFIDKKCFTEYVRDAVHSLDIKEEDKPNKAAQIKEALRRRKSAAKKSECWHMENELNQVISEIKTYGKVIPIDSESFVYDGKMLSMIEIMANTGLKKGKIKSILVARGITAVSGIDIKGILEKPKATQRVNATQKHTFIAFYNYLSKDYREDMGVMNAKDCEPTKLGEAVYRDAIGNQYASIFNLMRDYCLAYKKTNRYKEPSFAGFAAYQGHSKIKSAFNSHASKSNIAQGVLLFLAYNKKRE